MKMVCGLPRSRTAWLSAWLSDENGISLHEGINGCRCIDDYRKKFNEKVKYDCTTGFEYLSTIECDRLIILRDPMSSMISTNKILNQELQLSFFERQYQILCETSGMKIHFRDIDRSLEQIWDFIKGTKFDFKKI